MSANREFDLRMEAVKGWAEHGINEDCPAVAAIDAIRLLVDAAEAHVQPPAAA